MNIQIPAQRNNLSHVFLNFIFEIQEEDTIKGIAITPFTFIIPLADESIKNSNPTDIQGVTMIKMLESWSRDITLLSINYESHYKP